MPEPYVHMGLILISLLIYTQMRRSGFISKPGKVTIAIHEINARCEISHYFIACSIRILEMRFLTDNCKCKFLSPDVSKLHLLHSD